MTSRWGAAAAIAALAVLAGGARPAAIEANLPTQAVDEAIVFARMAQRAPRQQFHDRYARTVGTAPVNRISIVSEYRRVILLTEEKIRLGDRNYGVRQMTADVAPWRGQLEVIVELSLHPQNNYVGLPLIDVLLVPLDDPKAIPFIAEATDRIPRFGMFLDPLPPETPWWPFPPPSKTAGVRNEPLTGGWVLARFDAAPLATGRFDVVVKDGAKPLGSAAFDFGALR